MNWHAFLCVRSKSFNNYAQNITRHSTNFSLPCNQTHGVCEPLLVIFSSNPMIVISSIYFFPTEILYEFLISHTSATCLTSHTSATCLISHTSATCFPFPYLTWSPKNIERIIQIIQLLMMYLFPYSLLSKVLNITDYQNSFATQLTLSGISIVNWRA